MTVTDVPLAHSFSSESAEPQSPALPLVQVLDQLAMLIARLSDDEYARKPVGPVTSSIGSHVRHCLDHVRELLRVLVTDELDYDRRQRGTAIESDRAAALDLIDELRGRLIEISADAVHRSVWVTALMTANDRPVVVRSSVGREITFVLSHTIHHNALIGVIAKLLGHTLPERFGYAPATVAATMGPKSCAR